MMAGTKVIVEGRELIYFGFGEPIVGSEDIIGLDQLEDDVLSVNPRLRRVLTTLVRPVPKFYGALHWSDGTDLVELDRRLLAGEVNDSDFSGALLAEPRTISCTSCDAQFRCLAVDTGQPLFARSLANRIRNHELKTSCPVCSGRLGVPIVEFIGLGVKG